MNSNTEFLALKEALKSCFEENHVVKAYVFGSFARGEVHDNSDINLLVDFDDEASMLDVGGLYEDIHHKLSRKVHIVTSASLERLPADIIDSITGEARVIYEKMD